MNPETTKFLQSDVPQLKELIVYLATEAQKLNTLSDIKATAPMDIALETLARQRAYQTLTDILKPLVDVQEDRQGGLSNAEYVV